MVFSLLVLTGCAGTGSLPPVIDHTTSGVAAKKQYEIVQSGDTLYSIAWENGVDYRALAKRNGIRYPYIIKPGQKIYLLPTAANTRAGSARYYRVHKGETLYSIGRRVGIKARRLARLNNLAPPYTIKPGQKLRLNSGTTASTHTSGSPRSSTASSKTVNGVVLSPKTRIKNWAWPAEGEVIAGYKDNGNKGIDISGKRGQDIRAVAPGQVVYIGSRLPGYGLLIIVKHNTDYFSAYAHCRKAYVKEKDVIKQGAKIATMGSSGTDRVKLHFEIRYRGTPVNPLRLLPKR